MSFKPMRKPSKPTRETYEKEINIYDTIKINDALQQILDAGGDPNEASIKVDYGYGEILDRYNLSFPMEESDAIWKKKLEVYEKNLTKYNKWLEVNHEKLRIYEEKKEQEAQVAAEIAATDLINKLEKERIKIEKQLNKLKKKCRSSTMVVQ